MRWIHSLVQLALWTLLAHAFYPYTPAWLKEIEDENKLKEARRATNENGVKLALKLKQGVREPIASAPERAARDAASLIQKYNTKLSLESGDTLIQSRDNQYHVMEATDPKGALSAGIDQDGTDYSYFVQVELGSKKQKAYMLIDTGAGSSWVMGSSCTSNICKSHDTFGAEDSDSIEVSDKPFSITYGSGTVNGMLTTDTISLAGMSFKYRFGLASQTSDDFDHFAFDGILGLSMGQGSSDNFLDTLAGAQKLDSNIFAIALNRAADGSNNGEIKFGGTNQAKYTGDITYTALGNGGGDWALPLDDMGYNGKKANVGGVLGYIDTGTSFIFGPQDLVKKLHSVIPDAESSDGTTYTVPCDSNTPLTVTFSGVDYAISPKDWVSPKDSSGKCSSNIYGQEVVQGAWLLGDTFLKNVYAVFDKDKKQIGLAAVPETDSHSASQTTGTASVSPTTSFTGTTSHPTGGATTSKPAMGLSGHETKSQAQSTTSATGAKPTQSDSGNAAPGRQTQNPFLILFASVFGFVLLAWI